MTSYPPAPPPSYGPPAGGPPPGGPPPGGKRKLRGRIPLRLAIIFGVIGLGLAIAGVVTLVASPIAKTSDFVRAPVDGGVHTVQLTRTGKYVVYFETPSSGSHRADVRLAVATPSDTPVSIKVYGDNEVGSTTLTYDLDGKHGEAAFTFSITKAGEYQMKASSDNAPAGSQMAFGESIAKGLVTGLALFFPGLLLVIVAVILLIVGLVKRGRHKRELASAYGGGYPPAGYAPAYPPPGYPQQQGYPQQGYPQQMPPQQPGTDGPPAEGGPSLRKD